MENKNMWPVVAGIGGMGLLFLYVSGDSKSKVVDEGMSTPVKVGIGVGLVYLGYRILS